MSIIKDKITIIAIVLAVVSVSCKKKDAQSTLQSQVGVETRESFARRSNALAHSRLLLMGLHKAWSQDFFGEEGISSKSKKINELSFKWAEQWKSFDRFVEQSRSKTFSEMMPELNSFLLQQNMLAAQIHHETVANLEQIYLAKSRILNQKVIDYHISGYDQSYRQLVKTSEEFVAILDKLKEKLKENDEAIRLSHAHLIVFSKTNVLAGITARASNQLSQDLILAKSIFDIETDFGSSIAEVNIAFAEFSSALNEFKVFAADSVYRKIEPKCDAIKSDFSKREMNADIRSHYEALIDARCGVMKDLHRSHFVENKRLSEMVAKSHKLQVQKVGEKCSHDSRGNNCGLLRNISLISESDILNADSSLLADIERAWGLSHSEK